MPTDGTDFARMRACYGKFYTATKDGSPEAALAGIALEGLARDVRRDGGLTAFRPLVDLLTGIVSSELLTGDDRRGQLLDAVDRVERQHADSSLTREVCAVARRVGLKAVNGASNISSESIVPQMILGLVRSRCLDRASLYVTRHRTHSITETEQLSERIADAASPVARLLGEAIFNSPKGIPQRRWDGSNPVPIKHTADGLNNEIIADVCNCPSAKH